MSTIDILNGLQDYIVLLSTIREHEEKNNSFSKEYNAKVSQIASVSYSFIRLQLDVTEFYHNNEEFTDLYLECTFNIEKEKVSLSQVYCKKAERTEEIKKLIAQHAPVNPFPLSTNFNNYDEEILYYLDFANDVASQAANCSSGDNYRPGYFSQIIVTENQITLEQINHWNAKSSAHKEDYHLRNLEFYIPLKPGRKPSYDDQVIGKMHVHFSDRSSKNNKNCGNLINEKLRELKIKFENRKP